MKTNFTAVILVLITFFVISFITNILGPLFPSLVKDFDISLTIAGILPFSFFVAYGVMSIPSGVLVDQYGERVVMIIAFLMSALGSFWFAISPSFLTALGSLFLIGAGMAMLQVAINPLLRVAGGEEHFAFYSVLAQLLFGGAATLSPIVYSSIVQRMDQPLTSNSLIELFKEIVPQNMQWLSMYWIFAVLSLIMLGAIVFVRLPKTERLPVDIAKIIHTHKALFKNRSVVLFFIGIAAYVGTEQGVANIISIFLEKHHELDPITVGAAVVSNFWLMLTIGCVLGLMLLKLIDSRVVLKLFSAGAIIALTCAIFGDVSMAIICFPLVGFFLSAMWSIIFSLALNSVSEHHGSFAGILCTGIVGGGIASPLIGLISDWTGDLRIGLVVVYITLIYILSIGFWAKPIVTNKTLSLFSK